MKNPLNLYRYRKVIIGAAASVAAILPSTSRATEPEVWFCPLDPAVRQGPGYENVRQYMDLFQPDAPWEQAAAHLKVFKIYWGWAKDAKNEDLKKQFADLKRRGIGLALETGVLSGTGDIGKNIEGFAGDILLPLVKRIEDNGGDLQYVAMDEPLGVTFDDGPTAPHWTPQQIVDSAVKNIKAVQAAYPKVRFGDIEAVGTQSLDDQVGAYVAGWKAFKKAGIDLAFYHADLDWEKPSVMNYLVRLREEARKQGMRFGIIYDGNPEDRSAAAWLGAAQDHAIMAEEALGRPDMVIFQSWHPFPTKVLPEQDSDAFTHLLKEYARPRVNLTSSLSSGSLGGKLLTEDGRPIADATIQVTQHSLSKEGETQTLTATGIVPSGCTCFVFGLRANDTGWPGSNSVRIRELKLETKDGATVDDFQKPDGGKQWGGLGMSRVIFSDGYLNITPKAGDRLENNGPRIPIIGANQPFTFSIQARIPAKAVDQGCFGVFFLTPKTELYRKSVNFQTIQTPVGAAVTGADGSWSVPITSPGKLLKYEAHYDGSEVYWPARSSTTGSIP
jgi:hypothetical protein